VRLYVGVENTSEGGSVHLNRRVDVEQVGRALDACRDAGIFTCYNLLLFEPQATRMTTKLSFIDLTASLHRIVQ